MVEGGSQSLWELLKESVLWNTKAFVEKNKLPPAERGEGEKDDFLVRGNITDQGVLNFFMQTMGAEPTMAYMDRIQEEGKTLLTIPFSPSRKKATIVVR